MRRVFNSSVRGVAAVAVVIALSSTALAAPRDDRDRDRQGRGSVIVKVIKKIIRSFGDGLTIPRP